MGRYTSPGTRRYCDSTGRHHMHYTSVDVIDGEEHIMKMR